MILDLSALPDRGASILDLPDGDGVAPLIADQWPTMGDGRWPKRRVDMGRDVLTVHQSDRFVLDASRPSVQAHLCRWLAWRIGGELPDHAALLFGSEYLRLWTCHDGIASVLCWWTAAQCSHPNGHAVRFDRRPTIPEALVELVRAHA